MQTRHDLRTLARKIGFDPDYLESFEDKLFIQGPQSARRLTNFFVLLLLATVIATYGLIADSTASVIGAMIVAPLMGPIMAMAAAVVMGSAERALRSLALVGVGVLSVIGLSMALTWIVPDVAISFTENGQLSSRVAPGLLAPPILAFAVAPQKSAKPLAAAQGWLQRHNRTIVMIVSLIFGAFFLYSGVVSLLAFRAI